MNNDFTPKSRKENLVIQELEGEVLIYDLEKNKAFCLNETSALVWHSCDGSRTIADIGDAVGKQLNSQIDEDVIWLALEQLSKDNLIDQQTKIKTKFDGLSRREIIKKVGLGTMVALPIITSLVAPPAVAAASCSVTGTNCTCPGNTHNTTGFCTSGSCVAGCRCVTTGDSPGNSPDSGTCQA